MSDLGTGNWIKKESTFSSGVHYGTRTLAAASNASFAEQRTNVVLTHLIKMIFREDGLSDNAVE